MAKVDREYFESRNWHKFIDDERQLGYSLEKGEFGTPEFKIARWDKHYPVEKGDEGYYQFYCHGNNMTVECKISDESYDEEVVEMALKIIGINSVIDFSHLDFKGLVDCIKETSGAETNLEIYEEFGCGNIDKEYYLSYLGLSYSEDTWYEVCIAFGEYLGLHF